MLFTNIKEFHRTVRKVARESVVAKIKARCLTTLIGEIENKVAGKNNEDGSTLEITDELVLTTIRKFVKDINSVLHEYGDDYQPVRLIVEKDLLESYLPQNLTDLQLEGAIKISIACSADPSIGSVMKDLTESYRGLFDGKIAKSIILREL